MIALANYHKNEFFFVHVKAPFGIDKINKCPNSTKKSTYKDYTVRQTFRKYSSGAGVKV